MILRFYNLANSFFCVFNKVDLVWTPYERMNAIWTPSSKHRKLLPFFIIIKPFYCYSYLLSINSSFVNDINAKLTDLSTKFNEFTSKYDKPILSCSSVKASTLIYSLESFNWIVTLLLTLNRAEERQLNWTLFLQKFMMMFWRKVFVRRCH